MAIKSLEELNALNLPKPIHEQLAAALAKNHKPGSAIPVKGSLRRPEQDAGAELIKWVDSLCYMAPPLWQSDSEFICVGDYFAHNANGGARSAIEGAILKGQGVRKGWPDYTLYIPTLDYHGAVLELKAEHGGKPDAEQLEILSRLEQMGYKSFVCWGFEDAKSSIERYLDIDR